MPGASNGLGLVCMVLPATGGNSDEAREHDQKKNGVHMETIVDGGGPANWTFVYPERADREEMRGRERHGGPAR